MRKISYNKLDLNKTEKILQRASATASVAIGLIGVAKAFNEREKNPADGAEGKMARTVRWAGTLASVCVAVQRVTSSIETLHSYRNLSEVDSNEPTINTEVDEDMQLEVAVIEPKVEQLSLEFENSPESINSIDTDEPVEATPLHDLVTDLQ